MSISLKALVGYKIHASDGELGEIFDFYFDDKEWAVRYIVVQVGPWFDRDKIILSPVCVKTIHTPTKQIDVSLTKKQVENSPALDTEKTMTMQMEAQTLNYYRWPLYWTNIGIWGTVANFTGAANQHSKAVNESTHLRSVREVVGYYVQSPDKRFGKVEDVLVNSKTWAQDSFVAKTRRWLPAKSVVLNRDLLRSISWATGEFVTSVSSRQIRSLPKYSRSNDVVL